MIDNISWLAIYPEIVLLVMACVIALVDLGVGSTRRTATYVLTMLSLAVVAVMQAMYASSGNTFYGWGNMVVSDAMGNWLKCFATVSLMVTLVYGRSYALDRGMLRGGELFTLTMLALLGICVLISARASRQGGWVSQSLLSAGTTLCCFLIFIQGLGLPLSAFGTLFK